MTNELKRVEARMYEVNAAIAGLDKGLTDLHRVTSSTDSVHAMKRFAKKMDRLKDRGQALKSAVDRLRVVGTSVSIK